MRSHEADLLTEAIAGLFRAHGRLLAACDAIAAPHDLTGARWQVLGMVAAAADPVAAPKLAAALGMSRQGIQKQLNLLLEGGLIEPVANRANQRSPCYRLASAGEAAYRRVDAAQETWVNTLADGLRTDDLHAAIRLLEVLNGRLAPAAGDA